MPRKDGRNLEYRNKITQNVNENWKHELKVGTGTQSWLHFQVTFTGTRTRVESGNWKQKFNMHMGPRNKKQRWELETRNEYGNWNGP